MLALYAIKQCIASTLYASYISNCLYPGIRWRVYTIHKLIKSSSYIHLHFIVYCQHLVQKSQKVGLDQAGLSLLQINITWVTGIDFGGIACKNSLLHLSTITISCQCCFKSIFFTNLLCLKVS